MEYLKILVSILLLSFMWSCKKDKSSNSLPPLKSDEVATLPVIFHILHNGDPIGTNENYSAEKIQSYFNLLNGNFRNYTFNGNSVDIKIQFRLAQFNPNGNALAEPGINRVNSPWYGYLYPDISNEVVNENYWNPKEYINIWVGNTNVYGEINRASWARYPVATDKHPILGLSTISASSADKYVPSIPDGIYFLAIDILNDKKGVNLTHEMGHYLGLEHVFGENSCPNDYVDDTYSYNRFRNISK